MADTKLAYTPVVEVPRAVQLARAAFDSGRTKPLAWRRKQIKQVQKMVEENTAEIVAALRADLRRPEFEGVVAEAMTVVAEAKHSLAHLSDWAAPESVPTPPAMLPGSSYVIKEPLGVVCIIAPWNFPIQLCLNPLIAALSAGNTAVVKPSEVSPASAALLGRLIPAYLEPDAVTVVQGGVGETEALLACRFDHIFYTGNAVVARIVMAAAAKHLTPVTLELGGKSPAIVDATANLDLAAARIIGGKCMNAGQVCIAPDYVLVEASVEAALITKLKGAIKAAYGDDPQRSPDFGRIVNGRHWERVKRLLDTSSGEVVAGGQSDAGDRYISPTLIRSPKAGDPIMSEEIFGPLLPILPVADIDDAIARVRAGEKPLALYLFSHSSKAQAAVLGRTSSGGVALNDTILQIANPSLPFGGVGQSGLGAYHGKVGFDALSHRRAVFEQSRLVDTGPLRFPPYSPRKLALVKTLLGGLPELRSPLGFKDILLLGLSAAVVALSLKVAGKW